MEEKPKLTGWNYDDNTRNSNPELQQQRPVSWSEVADNMAADTKEHIVLRRFNVALIFITFIVAWAISSIIGILIFLATIVPIIIMIIQSPRKPSKVMEIAFWIFVAVLGTYFLL